MRNAHSRDFFAWCLSCCFAGIALATSAQAQPPGQNPDANAPVAVPPDTSGQTQAPVPVPPDKAAQLQPVGDYQPQPASETRNSFWGIEKTSEDDDWTRHFRIGAMVGLNISANFSSKGTLNISGNNAAQGNFDDGYVHPSGNGSFTSDFGYDSASQYNTSLHRLLMHQATSFTPIGTSGGEESGSVFPGFDMAYGGNLWNWGHTRIGWDLGFGLLPISITDNQSVSGNVNRNIYAFDISGIDAFIPAQPGYRGGPGGSVSIPSAPVATAGIPATDQVPGNITGSHTLDVMLYTVRLGPSFYWDLNDYLGLSASAGPAVGIVSGNYHFNETITAGGISTSNRGQIDGTDIVYGGYVNAMLMYHVVENGDLYLGVQYMPLGNASINGGGRQGQLNLGGQVYVSVGINWPF